MRTVSQNPRQMTFYFGKTWNPGSGTCTSVTAKAAGVAVPWVEKHYCKNHRPIVTDALYRSSRLCLTQVSGFRCQAFDQ
jgi:hypothetical protein